MLKNCVICGREFEATGRRKNALACSHKCHRRHENASKRRRNRRKQFVLPPLSCKCCGILFSPIIHAGTQKYCSPECRRQATLAVINYRRREEYRPKAKHERTCTHCGTEFMGYKKDFSCSKECSKALERNRISKYRQSEKGKATRIKNERQRHKDEEVRRRRAEQTKRWRNSPGGRTKKNDYERSRYWCKPGFREKMLIEGRKRGDAKRLRHHQVTMLGALKLLKGES